MLKNKAMQVKKHQALFAYANKEIPFYFWLQESTAPPDTVFFLGTGQVGKIPRWIAQIAPAGVVVVEGIPHWHSDASASDLVEFSLAYTKCAYEAVLETFKLPSMNIIGESQACPPTIWLANQLPEKIRNIALILPMGLNTSSFGETDDAKFKELRKRSLQTILHPEQFDLRNLYAAMQLLRIILSGMKDGSTVKKYTKGISQDITEEFRALLKHREMKSHSVTLFLGERDKLFPAHEIEQSLKKASINTAYIEIIPRKSHTSLVVKTARPIISRVVEVVRRNSHNK